MDLTTRHIIVSRHVTFDELSFPFAIDSTNPSPDSFDFLLDFVSSTPSTCTAHILAALYCAPSPLRNSSLGYLSSYTSTEPSISTSRESSTTYTSYTPTALFHVPHLDYIIWSLMRSLASSFPLRRLVFRLLTPRSPPFPSPITILFTILIGIVLWRTSIVLFLRTIHSPVYFFRGGANIVFGNGVFKHIFHSNGTLARYKARWVVHDYFQ